MNKTIIGAGLAGLITACKIKDAEILEAGEFKQQHKALLRFRDRSVSELTGIPFQEVSVHKEIYYNDKAHHQCTIAMANQYSKKVTGGYQNRSIWNLDTVKRYVAPDDLYAQLVDMHQSRLHFNSPIGEIKPLTGHGEPKLISTMPLPVMMKLCGMSTVAFEFDKSPIEVIRFKLPRGSKIYQTIYFPESSLRVFRASITGDLLIVELMSNKAPDDSFVWRFTQLSELQFICSCFGLDYYDLEQLEVVEQQYGKIVDIPKEQREAILYELTSEFGVFSIGRFATWRNILLDDVVKDISTVERLIAASSYGKSLVLSKR